MFHVAGRSLSQKTQTKSSSRTMLCSWQLGHRRNTTSWVKPEGRPSSASSRARATTDQEVTSGQYPVDWLLTSLTAHRSASRVKLISCGTQNHVSAGTGHVLAPSRRQPKHAVRAHHKSERLRQLRRRSLSDPTTEVGRRADPAPAAARPDRSLQLDRSDISKSTPPSTHVSQPRALPTYVLGPSDKAGNSVDAQGERRATEHLFARKQHHKTSATRS